MSACTPARRAVLSAAQLVELFGVERHGPIRPNALDEVAAVAASAFDELDTEELIGLRVDCSAIAADLEQSLGVRRLAASVALAAESGISRTPVDWDRVLDWISAGEQLHYERNR